MIANLSARERLRMKEHRQCLVKAKRLEKPPHRERQASQAFMAARARQVLKPSASQAPITSHGLCGFEALALVRLSRSASGSGNQAVGGERASPAPIMSSDSEELDVFLEARDDAEVSLLHVEEQRARDRVGAVRQWWRRTATMPFDGRDLQLVSVVFVERRGRTRPRRSCSGLDTGQGLGVVTVDVDGLRRPCEP